jgi:hypothetical protein
MALYEKSVKLLFRDMIKDLAIKKGEVLRSLSTGYAASRYY